MRLRVVAEKGVVAGHRRWLKGESFAVNDAVGQALLAQYGSGLVRIDGVPQGAGPGAPAPAPVPLSALGLSSRVLDALDAAGLENVAELRKVATRGEEAMLALPGIGRRALTEIREALERTDLASTPGNV